MDMRGSLGIRGSMGASNGGSLGMDAATLQRRIIALGIPPLPPPFGVVKKPGGGFGGGGGGGGGGGYGEDGRGGGSAAYSGSNKSLGSGPTPQQAEAMQAAAQRASKEWRPKVGGVVVQTLDEHVVRDFAEAPYHE